MSLPSILQIFILVIDIFTMLNTIINKVMMPILDNLLLAYPDSKNFFLEPGIYNISQSLNLDRDGVRIIGLTRNPDDVQIIQLSQELNAINISADNVRLEYITINGSSSSGICVYQTNCNWTNINTCRIYGNAVNHAVYFGGPNVPSDKTQIELYNNDILNNNSMFENNIVYIMQGGNAVTINMQNNFSMRGNIIRGGPISAYLLKNSLILDNYVADSGKQGISINLPVIRLSIENNTIYHSTAASIKLAVPSDILSEINNTESLIITNNVSLNSQYIGFEINNAANITIHNNKIAYTQGFAMYLLNATNINISNNLLMQFTRGIVLDTQSQNNLINSNNLYSLYPSLSNHAIILENNTTSNTVSNSNIYGKYISIDINDLGQNNVISGTNVFENISFIDEISKLNF